MSRVRGYKIITERRYEIEKKICNMLWLCLVFGAGIAFGYYAL